MIETLEKNPAAVMVYANYTAIDSAGKEIGQVYRPEPKYIFTRNVIGACFLYTADVAKKVGMYDANLFLAEDYDFWIRVYKFGEILHIEDDLYYYRIHEKSLSETKKNSVLEQTYKVLEKNFPFALAKSIENGLCNDFFDHMLSKASAHYGETLKMLLSFNKKYRFHLIGKKIKKHWEWFKVFVWNTRLWQIQRRLRGLV